MIRYTSWTHSSSDHIQQTYKGYKKKIRFETATDI